MAGSQVTVALTQIEDQRLGYQAISLTNFTADTEPQIAAGSKVEIGGALFEFTGNESVTGWASIGDGSSAYIKLTVSGSSVTASWTTSAPTWSTSKQGYYSGLDRYIGGCYRVNSTTWRAKWLYRGIRLYEIGPAIILEIGDWNMDATASVNIAHGLVLSKIHGVKVTIRDDADSQYSDLLSVGSSIDGYWYVGSTNVVLVRTNAGSYDNASYDATSYNRGWIEITYEP